MNDISLCNAIIYYHGYKQSLVFTRPMDVIANDTSKWLFSVLMMNYIMINKFLVLHFRVVEHIREKMLRYYTTVLPGPRD